MKKILLRAVPVPVKKRIKSFLHDVKRATKQTKDPNFIGFDKYRVHGDYHWWGFWAKEEGLMKRLDTIMSFATPQDMCLDIGCGDGVYAFALSQKCRKVVGVDADYDGIRLANLRLAENKATNCTCLQLPISKISTSSLGLDEKFDMVYSMDVIEHLPDPEELIKSSIRVLKPQGLVIIGTPIFENAELVSPYHVKEFTLEEITSLMARFLDIKEVILLPFDRKGTVYEEGYYVGVGVPLA